MRRIVLAGLTALALGGAFTGAASAARNPAGTGQPGTASPGGAACGSAGSTSMPPGFNSLGFANASLHYAGSPENPNAGNTSHAIAEYDIACYQQTQNHY